MGVLEMYEESPVVSDGQRHKYTVIFGQLVPICPHYGASHSGQSHPLSTDYSAWSHMNYELTSRSVSSHGHYLPFQKVCTLTTYMSSSLTSPLPVVWQTPANIVFYSVLVGQFLKIWWHMWGKRLVVTQTICVVLWTSDDHLSFRGMAAENWHKVSAYLCRHTRRYTAEILCCLCSIQRSSVTYITTLLKSFGVQFQCTLSFHTKIWNLFLKCT